MKRLIAAFALTAALGAWAVPTVTITKVQQDYPWSDVVGVDYTVEIPDGDSAEGCSLKFYATINDAVAEVSVSKQAESDPDLLATGAHTVYWTPAKNVKDTAAGLAAQVVKDGEDAPPMTVAELYALVQTYATKEYADSVNTTAVSALGNANTAANAAVEAKNAAEAATAKATAVESALADYAKTADVETALEDYAKTADVATTLEDYAKSEDVAQDIEEAVKDKADAATTLAGYGITDALITEEGVITLGAATIKPLTEHQSLDAYAKTADVSGTYATQTALEGVKTTADAALPATTAAETYLTKTDAGETYATQDALAGVKATADAAATQTALDAVKTTADAAKAVTDTIGDYAKTADVEATYATKDALGTVQTAANNNYLTIQNTVTALNGVTGRVGANETAISNLDSAKADKATTLAGYGITDAATAAALEAVKATADAAAVAADVSDALDAKADAEDVYTKTDADGKFAEKGTSLADYGITDASINDAGEITLGNATIKPLVAEDLDDYATSETIGATYATRTALADVKATADAAAVKTTVEAALAEKADAQTVAATYATKTALDAVKTTADAALPATTAANTYLTKTDAGATYLTKTDAGTTYQPRGSYLVAADIAGKANSADVYTKTAADAKFLTEHQSLADYAKSADVADTYATRESVTTASTQASQALAATANTYTKAESDNLLAAKAAATDVAADITAASNNVVKVVEAKNYLTAANITGKADKATTLGGYGITDAYTKTQTDANVATATNTLDKAIVARKYLTSGDISGKVDKTTTVNSKALSGNITLAASDVGAVPTTRKVNNKALSGDISLTAADVGAHATTVTHLSGDVATADFIAATNALQTAINGKQASGNYVTTARKVNNKALSADISLTAADVGAHATTVTHLSGDVPTSRKINGVALSKDLTQADLGITAATNALDKAAAATYATKTAVSSVETTANNALTAANNAYTKAESDSQLAAKANSADVYTKTAADANVTAATNNLDKVIVARKYLTSHQSLSGYVPTTRTVAGKALSGNVTLNALKAGSKSYNGSADVTITAADLGALTAVPSTYSTTAQMNTAIANATNGLASAVAVTGATGRRMFPGSVRAPYMVVDLTKTSNAVSYWYGTAEDFNTDEFKTTKMAFRYIPAGTYPILVSDSISNAVMACGYYIGIFEVTKAQYELMNAASPASTKVPTTGNMRAMDNLSWKILRGTEDIPGGVSTGAVCNVTTTSPIGYLNAHTGLKFDLPTESMWQIACCAAGYDRRAATNTWYYGSNVYDLKYYAWTTDTNTALDNDGYGHTDGVRVVGTKLPNRWGLYDMAGNVWEMCLDGCEDTDNSGPMSLTQVPLKSSVVARRFRGSAYNSTSNAARSANRSRSRAASASSSYGFRLSCIVP